MSRRYGKNTNHPRSVKQVIADIEEMMKGEVEGSKGYEQCQRALNYWRNRPKRRSKDDKTQS